MADKVENVKLVVQSIIVRYSAEQSGKEKRANAATMLKEVQRLYDAIAQDIIICIGSIEAHSDKFLAYHQLYQDYTAGKLSTIGRPHGLASLATVIISVSEDINHLGALTEGMSPFVKYMPVLAKYVTEKLNMMAREFMDPLLAKNNPTASGFLRAFHDKVINTLYTHTLTHATELERMRVPRNIVSKLREPLEAMRRAA